MGKTNMHAQYCWWEVSKNRKPSHLVRHLQHSFQCFPLHFFTFLEIWLHVSEEKLEHCSSEGGHW